MTETADSTAADLDLLQRIAAEEGVVTEIPTPGVGDYSSDLGESVARAMELWLAGWVPGVREALGPLAPTILFVLLATVSVLVVWVVVRRLLASGRARRVSTPRAEPLPHPVAAMKSATSWESDLDQFLARGLVTEALEALWWWFAATLVTGLPDPAWTSRELLRQTRRQELRPLADRLDRLKYGAEAPQREQVRALFQELREVLS